MRRKKRKKLPKINFQTITLSLWLVLGLFIYFIPPKNNLIITGGFSLLLAVLFSTAILIFKNWRQSIIISGGIALLFLLQFFSLLTLPITLTTTALIALSFFYFSL